MPRVRHSSEHEWPHAAIIPRLTLPRAIALLCIARRGGRGPPCCQGGRSKQDWHCSLHAGGLAHGVHAWVHDAWVPPCHQINRCAVHCTTTNPPSTDNARPPHTSIFTSHLEECGGCMCVGECWAMLAACVRRASSHASRQAIMHLQAHHCELALWPRCLARHEAGERAHSRL